MSTTIAPALGHSVVLTQQGTGTTPGYDAQELRRAWAGFERGEGVATYGSYRVSQRGAGANLSVDINQDDGAVVRGDAVTGQSLYFVQPHASTINEALTTAHATLPRIDQIVLEVLDTQHDASGSSIARTRVVDGTATAGATLDNRTGAAALPNSALLLADVLVAAADTTITDADIRDRRAFVVGVPPLLTDVDMVSLQPIVQTWATRTYAAADDLEQQAHLVHMPRRMAAATRIRWKYRQGATAATGNYVFALYDASGRRIIDTGSVALTGAANSIQVRSETITATTFEPGRYYVLFGLDLTNAGTIISPSVLLDSDESLSVPWANAALHTATGGATAPTTILGMTDIGADTTIGFDDGVPLIALSVG